MNVIDFYTQGKKVFNTSKQFPPFTNDELYFMNNIFKQKYRFCEMLITDQTEIDDLLKDIINKNKRYYQAILDSYAIEFDTLKTTNINEVINSDKVVSLTNDKTTTYNTNENISGNDDTTMTYDTSENSLQSDNNSRTSENTISGTLAKTGTDTTSNIAQTYKNAYDAVDLSLVDKVDTNVLNTPDLLDTSNSTSNVNDTEIIDREINNSKTGTDTVENDKNITNTKTGTDIDTITGNTNESNDITNNKYGYDGIDFLKAIEDIYKTKEVNVYDKLIKDVYDMICLITFDFNEFYYEY